MNREVNVEQYADGPECSAAIQAVIDSLVVPSQTTPSYFGGTVRFGPGVYRLGKPLRIGSNLRLLGAGQELTILKSVSETASSPIDCVLHLAGPSAMEGTAGHEQLGGENRALEIAYLQIHGRETTYYDLDTTDKLPLHLQDGTLEYGMTEYGIYGNLVIESSFHDILIYRCRQGYHSESYTWQAIFARCRVDLCHIGFWFNLGTSTTMLSCYTSNFRDVGFSLRNLIYSSLSSCACDGGGNLEYFPSAFKTDSSTGYVYVYPCVAYHIYHCRGVTLSACGTEEINNGTNFFVDGSKGCTIQNCACIDMHSNYDARRFDSNGSPTIRAPRWQVTVLSGVDRNKYNGGCISGFLILDSGNVSPGRLYRESEYCKIENCMFNVDLDSAKNPLYRYYVVGRMIDYRNNYFYIHDASHHYDPDNSISDWGWVGDNTHEPAKIAPDDQGNYPAE